MSVKRVFAIIGIVVGCVAAFVGGVLGVLALMGKFKTPVVKPEKLYFENPEQVVVAQYKDDDGKDVIYSFNLKAENNSIDHEVNVRECFIWFEKGVGEELIQLCDKDGNLLTADSKKRYAVNCNETLYFKIKVFYDKYEYNSSTWDKDCKRLFIIQDGKYVLNESEEYDSSLIYYTMQTYEEKYSSLDLSSLINGKVVLRARTADDTVQTSQDLVVWVDRNVSSIFLNYGDIPTEITEKSQVQSVNIGVDKVVEFNYVVNPEISLQPISKESKKIVELYYNDPKSEDFVLVNLENIKNTTKYSLHKIFDETKCVVDELTGELKLVFLSGDATNGTAHYFKIAIFPSYNSRAEFLADENNLSITNVERLQHMVTTDLYVQVVNINIDKVTLSDGELNLNLFTNNNDVYLKNEDAETLNLNVEMFAGDDKLDVRFDELDFKTITDSKNILNTNPKFLAEKTVEFNEINFSECSDIVFSKENNLLSFTINEKDFVCLVNSTISIGDYAIINTITDNSNNVTYSCNNGVALVYIGDNANAKTVTMLNVGSYLEFYIYDSVTQTYTLAKDYVYDAEEETYVGDITYSATPSGQYANKQWNVVVKSVSNEITSGDKTLVLGLLVANNEGIFNAKNLFATKPVTINVQDIHYEVKNSTATLNLLAKNEGFMSEDAGKDFDFFVNVDEGTYNACVFVISEKDIDNAIVDYVENLYYIDTKGTEDPTDDEKFYVVGYFEGGNFVNKVKTINNSNVTKETESKLQMLQLKNVYNETASGVIARIIIDSEKNIATTEVDISANVQKLFKTNISVKQNLVIDDEVEFKVVAIDAVTGEENPESFYSKTEGHTITITTPNNAEIITRICKFYGVVNADNSLNENYILNNYPQNANITGGLVDTEEEKSLVLTLNVGELLSSDVKVEIKLANVFTGTRTEETLYSFNIVDSAPTSIIYNYDGGYIELSDNQASAPVVTAEITWVGSDYSYNWYYNYVDKDNKGQKISINLNNKISGSEELGFQDKNFKIVQGVTYNLSSNAILKNGTSLSINSVTDNTYLSVTIAGVTRYLKLNVVQVGFALTQTNLAIDKEVGYLNDSGIVDYKFDGASVYNNAINDIKLTNINVLYTNSKAGTLKVYETESDDGEGNKIYTYPYTYKYEFEDGSSPSIILTITKDATEKDWKFAREDDKYAALSVSFNVVTKTNTLNCSIKFTSGIEHEYNASAWGITPKLYQDTTVQIYEIQQEDNEEFKFETEALIKIRNYAKLDNITVECYYYDALTEEYSKIEWSDNYIALNNLGKYKFIIKDDNDEIQSYEFNVVPNIVVKQDTATNLILDSGIDDVSTALYNKVKLYSYKTSYIYGKDKDADNGNKVILYSTEFDIETGGIKTSILEEKTNDLKSSVTMQSKEGPETDQYYVFTDVTIKTVWIDLIDEMHEVNVVVKSGNYEVGTFTAIVKNNYKVSTEESNIVDIDPDEEKTNYHLNIKAMVDIANMFTINNNFALYSIEFTYSNDHSNNIRKGPYIVGNNELLEIPAINEICSNVNWILTFKEVDGEGKFVNVGKTLVFNGKTINGKDLTINVVPFEFEDSDNINKAYSENKFNLLKDVIIDGETIYGVYNASDLSKFNYIKVLSVKDENGNSLIPDNLNLGFAYNYANPSNGLTITFDKLYEDSVKALIEYEVQYAGSSETYIYKKAITLQNWQALQVKYPENEAATDADKYLSIEEVTLSNGVKYVNQQYEAVVIDNLESYTIDLKDIQNKNISRITAKDRTNATAEFTTNYEIESLEILAYENTINFPTYIKTYGNIELDKNNATITFNNYGQNFFGIVVFKLTTTSGNSIEYFVRVTCLGGNTEVSGTATGFVNIEYKNDDKNAETTDDGLTISNLINADFIKTKFNNVTKFDATKVKMFLLNATVLADNNKDYNKVVFGDTDDENPIRYTCVNDKTLTINDYTTITLSLIYYDSENGYVYPIGILTLYLRPNGAVNSQSTGFKDVYSLVNEEGIENGEFKYTILANSNPIPFPTDFNVVEIETGKKYILDSEGNLVDFIEGIDINSNITIVNQVTSAKVFTVFYVSNTAPSYTIKVTYTLNPVEIKSGSTITIGEFDQDLNKFVDTFVIDADNYEENFGTYQGQIKIGNATFTVGAGYKFSGALGQTIIDDVSYTIGSNDELILTFEQGLYDETKEINVYYSNLSDSTKQNQTYTFNVKRGLYIGTAEGDNSGLNSSQRKTTETSATIDYDNSVGSKINIKKDDITNGVKYEFAGYKIYIKNAPTDTDPSGKLEFEFNTIKDDTGYADSDYNLNSSLTFNDNGQLAFVHMPKTKNIDVSFTISNDAGEFQTDASTVDMQTLYLTIAKTYQQVEDVYLTKDASAENVIKGITIEILQDYLFAGITGIPSDIANKFRLKLKKLDETYVDFDINFAGMGFTDPDNPNFINFTLDNGSKATLTINGDYKNITFDNSITANEKCIVYLDNIAGMPTAEYDFQIMADNKVDGFTFSTEGYPDKTTTATPVDYMSFVIRKDENANAEYSTGKLKIGTIKDGLSKGVHVWNGSTWVFLPKAGTDDERMVSIDDGSNKYYVSLEMDPYNNANWDIYLDYHRLTKTGVMPDKTEFTLNIHGTSGYILNNLTIVLFNTEIGPKYTEGRQGVLGGESFHILNHDKYGLKVPTGVDLEDVSFELAYDLSMVGESNHAINTKLSDFNYVDSLTNETKNSLIDFKDNLLTTKTVGKNVDINLVFRVKIDDYYLNNVTYQIQLKRSIQFFFNGDEPVIDKDGKWETNNVTAYSTNFVLTNLDGGNATNFGSNMKFSFNISGDPMTIDGGKTYYFFNLLFELEDCVGGQAAGISIIKDPSKTNPDDSILKVDNEGITFYKDYTGKLYLTLTAGLRNGFNYTVSWTIDVFGILDIQPQYKTDDEGLTSSSMPYNSGQSVDLLGDEAGGSTGLYLKDMEDVFDADIDYDENASNKLQATYQYAIIKYNPYDGYSNKQRFDKFVDDGGILLGNTTPENVTNRTINIPLPVVPRTGSEESYLVIYKVDISYLGYAPESYYVAYKVVYNLNISVTALKHGNGDNFDADNINVNGRLVSSTGERDEKIIANNKYLDLFKYSETYTHTTAGSNPVTTNYIIRLGFNESRGNVYQAKINSGEFEEVQIEPTSNANQLRLSKDGETWITITKSTVSTETESYWKITEGTGVDEKVTNASLFTLNFSNITEFAKFINEIDGIVIKQPTVEYKFTLTHIADGRWGIDLTTKYKKLADGTFDENKDTTDLFKNKLEDAEFIIRADSGQTIYSIDKYISQQNTGFRMHTSKELIAAGSQKFNDLFVKETVTTGWLKYQYYDIIGVYGNTNSTPQPSWVNVVENGSITTIEPSVETLEDISDVTISVPTGTGSYITYTLQKVEYSVTGGGVNGICSLEQDFYVVYCEDHDAVYKMNLNPGSVELYKQGEDTIVNLRNYFVKYKNNDDATSEKYGELEIDETTQVTAMAPITNPAQPNIEGGLSADEKTYIITEANLIAYRNANLTVGNDVTITYSATFGDVEMEISINYQLPSLSTVVAYQNSLDSNVGITSIYVPDKTSATGYTKLENYLGVIGKEVTSIVENGSNYTAENGFIKDLTTEDYTGYIKLNKTAVDNYFNTHTTAKFLEIKYTITTRTENKSESIDFVIMVRKGDAPAVS